MNCKKCGAPLVENDQFCKNCGAAVNVTTAQNNVVRSQSNYTQNEFSNYQQQINNRMSGQTVNAQPANNYQQQVNNRMGGQTVNAQPANNYQQQVNNRMGGQTASAQPVNNYQQQVNNRMGGQTASTQPVNNYQQSTNSYANSYNSQPMNQPQKSNNANNSTKFVFIGIAIVAIIAVILVFVLGDNNGGTNNGGSSVNNNSSYTVKFKGFTFKIPTNFVYETSEDSIALGDEEGTWAAYIEVLEGSYNQILAKKNQLQSAYQSMGYKSSAAVEKTIDGMPFITLEISMSGTNALLGITKANSMNVFGITAYNIDNEYDYNLLKTISSILSSAEYTGKTNNMSVFQKVDMSGISNLAQ